MVLSIQRIEKVRNKLATMGLDGMYVTNLTNVRYLTGFTGSAGSLLILEKNQYFFTDGRYIEQSKEQVKNSQIYIVNSTHYNNIKEKKLISNNQKIAIEGESLSLSIYNISCILLLGLVHFSIVVRRKWGTYLY